MEIAGMHEQIYLELYRPFHLALILSVRLVRQLGNHYEENACQTLALLFLTAWHCNQLFSDNIVWKIA